MKRVSKIVCLLLSVVLSLTAVAQQLNISGTVLDESGEPVPGASVVVKGTTTGAITDVSGSYSIQAPADAILVISSAGMADREEAVGGRARIDVGMGAATNELDEVVLVGYGVQKRAHLTGAVATVAPTEIADLVTTDMSSALEGIVAGVSVTSNSNRPGEASRIIIRNSKEVPGAPTSSTDLLLPLYVIDDFISSEAAFNNLDPSTVESISILKDASAAVYGARSAQGVVLVKTKRGTIGAPKISYNGQYGWTDEYYRNKMMNSYDFGVTWNAVRAADPNQIGFKPLDHLFQADELEAMKGLNYDLLEQHWSSAITQKHSVNVSGGSENANYFGSVGYTTQEGNLGRIDYSRWNYRAGMDAKINKWTKASIQVSGDYGNTVKSNNRVGGLSEGEKDYAVLLTRPRYIPEYVTDPATGTTYPIAPYGVGNNRIEEQQHNHYSVIQGLDHFVENSPQNMVINSGLEHDFGWNTWLKGLKLRATYSKSISNTKDNSYGSIFTLYKFIDGVGGRGGSGGHIYTDTEGYPMSFDNLTGISVPNNNSLRRDFSRSDNYQLNFIASYARDFGKHSVSGLFTIEKSESEMENLWASTSDPYTFTNLQSSGALGTTKDLAFSRSEAGNLSYVGRLNYAYDDKYLAEFLIRVDASTRFAPENYWGAFPSLSLGWIISKESWFSENVSFVDFLKLRGSFGIAGRDNIRAWEWLQTYTTEEIKGPIFGDNPSLNSGPHFQYTTVPNRNAHWDKTYKSNYGIDANFLAGRLNTSIDAYYNWQREVFMTLNNAPDYPVTVGASATPSNYGAINDYGVEASLGWRDKIGSDFKYYVRLTTGWSDNKVITAPFPAAASRGLDALMPNESSDRGEWGMDCIGMFRSYQEIAEYFAENNIRYYFGKDVNNVHPGTLIYRDVRGSQKEDGTYYAVGDPEDPNGNQIDDRDMVKISDRKSNVYGFTVNFGGEWKGLSVGAQLGASWGSYALFPNEAKDIKSTISTAQGYDVMQYTNLPSFYAGNMFIYEDVLDAQGRVVAAQNLDAKYPNLRFTDNNKASTFWRVNAANIFLRNLTVAYTLPKAWANKVRLSSCRVNITAQNLFELYNPYPDKFMSPNSNYGKYPSLRRITMGLNVSF